MIAVAVSNDSVGVDVEKIKEIDTRIAKRFFTKQEFSYIEKFQDNRSERFFKIWTKKRSLCKVHW